MDLITKFDIIIRTNLKFTLYLRCRVKNETEILQIRRPFYIKK